MQRLFRKRSGWLITASFFLSLLITDAARAAADPSDDSQTDGPQVASPATPITSSGTNAQTAKMNEVVVLGKLDQARDNIVPSLGATQYSITQNDIDVQSQGVNAPFNQVLLRAPGVVQDSFGQIHVRGEHANLQYRINDVLIPEGITGFGNELDTRIIDKVSLITGALPAQFGYRTTGIVDIHTKSGAFDKGGDVSYYGGSY